MVGFYIIDNKKLEMTVDEYAMYQKIVASYTKQPYQKGEDLFIDLFEVDDDGIIIYLKPPSQRQVSLEIFLFCMSICQHQHLRAMHREVTGICARTQARVDELCKQLEDKIAQK
jgi:hypothetical protein